MHITILEIWYCDREEFIIHILEIYNCMLCSYTLQYIDTGRHSDAIATFRAAIDQQRDHSNAWNNLALLYENLSKYT